MGLVAEILGFIGQREQAGLEKEQWKVKKQQLDMAVEERNMFLDAMKNLSPEERKLGVINKELLGKTLYYNELIKKLSGGNEQQPSSPTFEQTGEAFRPTQEMVKTQPQYQQPNLTGQIANQKLFGGMNPQDMMGDIIKKETGIGESVEPVRTEPMLNPNTNRMEIGQILRNGQIRFTGQMVPPEIQWHDEMGSQGVVKVATDKYGNRQPQFDRTNVPQQFTSVSGAAGPGNQPGTAFLPQNLPPGTQPFFIPGAVKGEPVTMTGPRNEQSTAFVNPFSGGGTTPSKGGLPGIQTKPPQPVQVTEASKRSDIEDGVNSLLKVKDLVFNKDGSINRTNLFNAYANIPRSKGKMIKDFVYSVIDPIQRARTGAVINPNEEKSYRASYGVDYMQSDEQIRATWAKTINYLNTFVSQLDPNEAWVKNLQSKFSEAANIPGGKKGMNLKPSKSKTNPYQKMTDEEFLKARP